MPTNLQFFLTEVAHSTAQYLNDKLMRQRLAIPQDDPFDSVTLTFPIARANVDSELCSFDFYDLFLKSAIEHMCNRRGEFLLVDPSQMAATAESSFYSRVVQADLYLSCILTRRLSNLDPIVRDFRSCFEPGPGGNMVLIPKTRAIALTTWKKDKP